MYATDSAYVPNDAAATNVMIAIAVSTFVIINSLTCYRGICTKHMSIAG